jgi:hypothetical protein
MNRFRIFLVTAVLIFMGVSCKTQQPIRVQHVRNLETGHSLQGFYYALPRTVLIVDVTVVKTTETPGPFAPYAGRFLGLENVITTPSTIYEIREVNINSYAEPDPAEFYFVELDLNKNHKNPLSLYMSEGGLISAVNAPFDQQEFLLSTSLERKYGVFGSEATFNHFVESNLHEKVDTIIQQIQVDTMTVERRTLRRRLVEKSSEIRAKEVADYILKIRDKKFDLISGFAEIPYSKETLQYMNDQLTKQENNYLELFTGMTTQSKIRYRYYFIPDKNTATVPYTLFHFSETNGIVQGEEPGSQAVNILASRTNTTRQLGVFVMNPDPRKTATGFYYRIPEHGNITVSKGGNPIADARLLINQFGVITSLPPTDLKIEFYPNTGFIKSVEKIK